MSSAKIVGIHGGRSMSSGLEVKPLPVPLVKLRDEMKFKLKDLLRKLFDNTDDALFAMADKSGTNGDQTIYFDAMRELRLQKKTIATEVLRGLIKSFNEMGNYRSKTNLGDELEDWENLGLVQNDELELNVAVEGMVTRLRSDANSHLEQLKLRIESLQSPMTLSLDQVPLSPEMLCDCFSDGCSGLNVAINVRLVIFKLFEKYVLSEMTGLYIQSNKLLVSEGVMPHLKAQKINFKRSPPVMSSSAHKAVIQSIRPETIGTNFVESGGIDLNGGQVHEEVPLLGEGQCLSGGQFESIRALMHPKINDALQAASSVEQYYTQEDLLMALSGVQQKQLSQPEIYASNNVIDYKVLLKASLPKQAAKEKYSELDSDVINLVSMLFDFILDDRQLQPVMKALISRLQIPILKVAIMDRSFFDRGGHPARKLLNEIASAAIGWNEKPEGQPDRLKDKVEETVQSILTNFNNDQSLFETLLASFTKFIDLEQRRGQLVEQRTKDSERGKAANDVANQDVHDFLNNSIKRNNVPSCVVILLNEAWSRVMVLYYLKEGKNSNAWRSASELVNDLIITVCPDIDALDTSSLMRKIPSVMRRLRTGLAEISFDEFRTKDLLKSLEAEHIKALQILQDQELKDVELNSSVQIEPEEFAVPDKAQGADTALTVEHGNALSEFLNDTQALEDEFNNFQRQVSDRVEGSLESNKRPLCDEVLINPSVAIDKASEGLAESDPFMQQVLRLAPGCWFEFKVDSGFERCKLAAIIKITGMYIFVNRSGVKVAEKTKSGLALELKQGTVQVLNDGLLFDRALESVIGSLRSSKKDK